MYYCTVVTVIYFVIIFWCFHGSFCLFFLSHFFAGLMSPAVALFLKFGLWSFIIMKHFFFSTTLRRFPRRYSKSVFYSTAILFSHSQWSLHLFSRLGTNFFVWLMGGWRSAYCTRTCKSEIRVADTCNWEETFDKVTKEVKQVNSFWLCPFKSLFLCFREIQI